MKKLVLFMAVATAVAFAACGNEETTTETPAEENQDKTEQQAPETTTENGAVDVENVEGEQAPAEDATPAE